MWTYSLGGDSLDDVRKVRKLLDPRSNTLKAISADSNLYKSQYDEYTCEWFQRHLLEFTRGKDEILAITAPAGCGKTVLSSWIHERLQRPMDNKIHNVVSFKVDSSIPREANSLALAKSLALQLLDIRIGNVTMFDLIQDAQTHDDPATIEKHLWAAISVGFSNISQPTMLLVDGLDELTNQEPNSVLERISTLAKQHASLKAIILSRPFLSGLPSGVEKARVFDIKPDHVYEDVRHLAKHGLKHCEHYMVQKEDKQRPIVEHLTKTVNGNFLWLALILESLKKSKSLEEFSKGVWEGLKNLDESIKDHIEGIKFSNGDVKMLLSLLLVTERPLTVGELELLLRVDTQRKVLKEQIDIDNEIQATNGMLKVSDSGVIRFRHGTIRRHFLALQTEGKKILGMKNAQTELTSRLLAYSKLCLTAKHDVCLEKRSDTSDVDTVFSTNLLLEYAIRNWTWHFYKSTLYKSSGALGFSNEFKALFPSSTYMALLEWTCWDGQASRSELITMYELSLRIRTEVFTEKHECALQSVIVCGHAHKERSSLQLAAGFFARASRIGQIILQKFSKITVSCTTMVLTITETMSFTSRTEIVTYREEMLKFIITVHKHEHGENSDIVIRYYKALAELYVHIHEEEHAAEIWKIVRTIVIIRHGEGSEQEREISGKLMVVLKGRKDFEIEKYCGDIFAIGEETTIIWDARRIAIFLEMAISYEERKEWYEAEEIYVMLWTKLLHLCRHQHAHDIEFRISVIKIAIEYCRFLERRHRHEEARNVLIIIWSEHEHLGCESMAFYLQLKIIGTMMKSLGLLSISISIFSKIVAWFKATGKHDHEEVHICEKIIIETIEEVTKIESHHHHESTTEVETIVRKMFSSTTVVTKESIQVMRTTIQLYIKKEEWSEAIVVLTRSLMLIWGESSSWEGAVCLPGKFVEEAVEFAILLGECHIKCKHYHEALTCYTRLWYAVRFSCGFHDHKRTKVIGILISFYQEHKRWKLLIQLHRELLVEYRKHHGKGHIHTIGVLYLLGSLCYEHGHGHAEDYYREIIEVTTDVKISFKAYKMLCQIYYDESRWFELKDVCSFMWQLFVHHHKEHEFEADFVELLYIRYTFVLEYHFRCSHEELVAIAIQFKEVCIKKFGVSSAITICAMMTLGSVLVKKDTTRSEAISVYEEIITIKKTTKTVDISDSSMTIIKKHLTEAYIHKCSHGTTTTETITKAILILQERFDFLKVKFGYAHKETLTVFYELLLLHFKLKSADSEKTIIHKLQEVIIEIVTKEKRSQYLFDAAGVVGSIYVTCGLHAHGFEIMRELRRQIVTLHMQGGKSVFKIDKSVGRIAFVFLVAFELTLKGSVNKCYSDIMADWLTESVLYEAYNRSFTVEVKIEVFLLRSARLRSFWEIHGHQDEIKLLDTRVTEYFFTKYSTTVKASKDITRIFLVAMLAYIGAKETYTVQLSTIALVAGNTKVAELLKEGKYQQAHEVGHCTFHFVNSQGGYHKPGSVGYGFQLAHYMASRGAGDIPAELRTKMLATSREIMTEVLHVCKEMKVNFNQLHDHELDQLVELLGEQKNYTQLEVC